jgi:DNA-binding response OmpR family regulator
LGGFDGQQRPEALIIRKGRRFRGEAVVVMGPPRRVLLVDDNEEILEWMVCALTGRGYEILTARDGVEALVRTERDRPDLVVLDVVMPRRTGFSVLERLRTGEGTGPRILMVTASDGDKPQNFAQARGADAFLRKPFEVEEFLQTVDALLEK